jgi:hypothetical protein
VWTLLLLFIITTYLLYRVGKWLIKFSNSIDIYNESSHDYNQKLLAGIEEIARNTSSTEERVSRLDALRAANAELIRNQEVRKMIEEELDIEM